MRLIDADELEHELVTKTRYMTKDHVLDVAYRVNKAPTIDAVPVVRCGECKYRTEYFDSGKYVCTRTQCIICGHANYVNEDDFCSYGERVATTENSKKLASHSKGR